MSVRPSSKAVKAMKFATIAVVARFQPRLGSSMLIQYFQGTQMRILGEPTFVSSSAWFDSTQNYGLITLHEGCNISRYVRILTHDWSAYTALKGLGANPEWPVGRQSPVVIGPHAFIGLGATVLAGSTIGRGAIIGAGTVVRGSVPDHAIAVGNPMQILGDAREHLVQNYPDVTWPGLNDFLGGRGRGR